MRRDQTGFTLVEIAIVLVIIGLLLGGILKGQEMMSSAKVRNLADASSAAQTAYFGFIDRFRRVPGDWNATAAERAIGVTINAGGNPATFGDNGRLDNPVGATVYDEANAMWEHLSKAGFIQGSYEGGASGDEPDTDNNLAPLNPFRGVVTIGWTPDYQGSNPVSLGLFVGRNVPAKIMRELDTKIDDGLPATGVLRATLATPTIFLGGNSWGGSDTVVACVNSPGAPDPDFWDVAADSQDCNAVLLF